MIPFELFDKIITAIKEQDAIDDKIDKALELVCDSWVMMNSKNKKYEALILLLTEVMGDKNDWISWWIYEDVKKECESDGKKTNLSTTRKLYDFLVKNKSKS